MLGLPNLRRALCRLRQGKPGKFSESFAASPTLRLPLGTFVVEAITGDTDAYLRYVTEVRLDEGGEVAHVFELEREG